MPLGQGYYTLVQVVGQTMVVLLHNRFHSLRWIDRDGVVQLLYSDKTERKDKSIM